MEKIESFKEFAKKQAKTVEGKFNKKFIRTVRTKLTKKQQFKIGKKTFKYAL